jgi:hypothetical protein
MEPGDGQRGPKLVQPETLQNLHRPVFSIPQKKKATPATPTRGKYALGWGELSVDWALKPLIYHGASNPRNVAASWLDLRRDFAMVLVTNTGGSKADEALFGLAPELFIRFVAPQSPGERPR